MDFDTIKDIVKDCILKKARFKELQNLLPDVGIMTLRNIIIDVAEELNLNGIPYISLFIPKYKKQPIQIDEEGSLNIHEILFDMGLEFRRCQANYRIDGNKIILSIKPLNPKKELDYMQLESYIKYKKHEERVKALRNELADDENEKLDYDDDECDPYYY